MFEPLIGIARDAASSVVVPARSISMAAGETGTVPITVYHADGVTLYNLGNCSLLLVVWGAKGYAQPLISRPATIVNGAAGMATLPILVGDTLAQPGSYSWEIWLTDANTSPNGQFRVCGVGAWDVNPSRFTPGMSATVPPSQQPLGLGMNWRGPWSSSTSYQIHDGVSYPDPNGGGALSSFICLVANTNVPPVNGVGVLSIDWNYIAATSGATGSQTASLVYASPAGAPGFPSFRSLVIGDLPVGATSSTVAVGSDVRFPPAPSGAGRVVYDTGSAYASLASPSNGVLHAAGAAPPSWGAVGGTDFAAQSAALVFAGPTSGGSASPGFRSLVIGDLPVGTSSSTIAVGNDSRFPPAPSTANNILVDSGSAYVSQALYPTVTGEVGVTNKLFHVGDVRRYGAVADWNGSSGTDNRTAIQNAITSANAIATINGGFAYVTFPCGTFMVGQGGDTVSFSLYGLSNVIIRGQGPATIIYGNIVNTGNYTHHTVIGASGTWTDLPGLGTVSSPWQNYPALGTRLATNAIALGALTLTANPTGGFATVLAGDWIEICEGTNNGTTKKWDYKVTRAKVASVVGDTLTLAAPVEIDFNNESGDGVGIFRITPVENFWIQDLTITGSAQAYGPFFQTTVGGGLSNVTVKSDTWVNPFWYANNTHKFWLKDCVATTGLFGGFNRGSHGLVTNATFLSVGSQSVEFGQGEIYNRWFRNKFLGCTLAQGNDALISGAQSWHNSYDENVIACDSTITGVFHCKGTSGTTFRGNTISIGGTASYVINASSSDGTNTGLPAKGLEISGNTIYVDGGAAAPALGAAIFFQGNPQLLGATVRGNKLLAPAAWNTFIKFNNGTTTATNDIVDNVTVLGTPFPHTFSGSLAASTSVLTPILDAVSAASSLQLGGANANAIAITLSGSQKLNIDASGDLSPQTDGTVSTGATLGLIGSRFGKLYTFNVLAGQAAAVDVAGGTLSITGQAAGAASAATGKVGGPITVTPGRGSAGNNAGGFSGGTGAALNLNGAQGGDGGAAIAPGAGGAIVSTTGAPGSQNGGSGNGNSGFYIVNVPAPVGAGSYGQYQFQFGGSNHLTLNQTDTLQFAFATGNKTINITGAAVDTAGVSLTITGQQGGNASAVGGGKGGGMNWTGPAGGSGAVSFAPGGGADIAFTSGNAGADGGSGLNASAGNVNINSGTATNAGSVGTINIGTTRGTVKISSASGLMSLYGVAAVGQYSTTGTSTGFTAGAGTTVTHLSTFTGNTGATAYTIGDAIRALKLIGAILA